MTSRRSLLATVPVLLALDGCASASLWPQPPPQPELFTLDAGVPAAAPVTSPADGRSRPSLVVGAPRAAAGHDDARIAYQRRAQQIEYFAYARWVDAPARMLAPLIVAALQRSGAFASVVPAAAATTAELRLDTELVRLLHDFSTEPGRERLTLRATLIDAPRRRVLATREFDVVEGVVSPDPYGGVIAAQRAVQRLLVELVDFCAPAR